MSMPSQVAGFGLGLFSEMVMELCRSGKDRWVKGKPYMRIVSLLNLQRESFQMEWNWITSAEFATVSILIISNR